MVALAGAISLSLILSGCGVQTPVQEKVDGTKTVATVNGEAIPFGVLSVYTRRYQAQMEALYMNYFGSPAGWDNVYDEATGMTYGDEVVGDVLDSLETMVILKRTSDKRELHWCWLMFRATPQFLQSKR